jgi:hypothetical protein
MHVIDFKRTSRRPLLAGLVVAALIAGCGDSDDDANVPSSPTAAAPTAVETAAPTGGKKGKKGNKGKKGEKTPVVTPAPQSTSTDNPEQPPPLTNLKPAHIEVTASGGIVLNPDPLPAGENLDFTVNGPGLGRKANIRVFDTDGKQVAYARLLKRDVKMQLPAFDAGKIRIEVHGTNKVKPSSRAVSVR